MQKIIEDLEDFSLPYTNNQNSIYNSTYKNDKLEQDKIENILKILIQFTNEKTKYEYDNLEIIRKEFTKLYAKECRNHKLIVKKIELISTYRNLLNDNKISENILLEKLLCKKPSRSISGISSITLVMSPYPNGQSFSCKHNCYYCPNEPAHKGNEYQAQPRSYLYHEPAVRRANRNNFDSCNQMNDRMNTLFSNGHVIDKLEIIIEGGTYTEYPEEYLNNFNRDIYYSANTYHDTEKRSKKSLDEEVYLNRYSRVHIIGLCIETRPDSINETWVKHFRRCGVTRIQLGVQTTHNHILKKVNRGHTIECVIETMEYLRNLCFKIDIHLMPDLPYSTPELDKKMFDYTYSILLPDQIKIYPCAVVPWTVIEKWYNSGKWKPYTAETLKDVMDYGMINCPRWIRLPRVIRDIPEIYIQAGNKKTNLRQTLVETQDIRSREIERHPEYYNKPAKIFIELYNNNNGVKDYFISYESYDKKALFGFIRLRLPITENNDYENDNDNDNDNDFDNDFDNNNDNDNVNNINKKYIFDVLKNKALIRELHVYGYNTEVGKTAKASQHNGIGTKLLKKAENIAYFNNYDGTVVISGEGVKEYYSKRGYSEKETYMYKNFIFRYDKILYLITMTIITIITYFIKIK